MEPNPAKANTNTSRPGGLPTSPAAAARMPANDSDPAAAGEQHQAEQDRDETRLSHRGIPDSRPTHLRPGPVLGEHEHQRGQRHQLPQHQEGGDIPRRRNQHHRRHEHRECRLNGPRAHPTGDLRDTRGREQDAIGGAIGAGTRRLYTPQAIATPPTIVMKSPESGSTTSTASLSGSSPGSVVDQSDPAEGTRTRDHAPDARQTGQHPGSHGAHPHRRQAHCSPEPAPPHRPPARGRPRSHSSTAQPTQRRDDGLGLRRTTRDRHVHRHEVPDAPPARRTPRQTHRSRERNRPTRPLAWARASPRRP